jgi:hypothetical protein
VRAETRGGGPSWKVAVAVMVAGALLALPLVVKVVTTIGASVTARSRQTPFATTEHLDEGRYVVFEHTGTTRQVGPISGSNVEAPTLTIESVRVKDPSGRPVQIRYDESNETITQGSAVYVGVLVFDAPTTGAYEITVVGEGRRVLITRSLGQSFRRLGGPFALASFGGLVFALGLIALAVGLVRRGRAAPVAPWPTQPAQPVQPAAPAGWYPDPSGASGQRYWDGVRWTDHVAP